MNFLNQGDSVMQKTIDISAILKKVASENLFDDVGFLKEENITDETKFKAESVSRQFYLLGDILGHVTNRLLNEHGLAVCLNPDDFKPDPPTPGPPIVTFREAFLYIKSKTREALQRELSPPSESDNEKEIRSIFAANANRKRGDINLQDRLLTDLDIDGIRQVIVLSELEQGLNLQPGAIKDKLPEFDDITVETVLSATTKAVRESWETKRKEEYIILR